MKEEIQFDTPSPPRGDRDRATTCHLAILGELDNLRWEGGGVEVAVEGNPAIKDQLGLRGLAEKIDLIIRLYSR